MRRIGVDVGGTFTDLIYVDDEAGTVIVHKTPSTPADPSEGTVKGITELCGMAGVEPSELDQVFHGTTIATNIVIEHNGARVGMITTKGYRDILHIARHKRPMNFSLWQQLPWQAFPIVRRRYRLTVNERIDKNGDVLIPLDDDEVRAQVRRLKEAQVESVSVCLLFSFVNADHERRVAEIVREEFPEAFLSVSSEVIPQYREYERFSTNGLNAFVGPKVARYVERFDQALRGMGVSTGIHLMTSAAGVATPEGAIQRPVTLLMSGPIAGVVGGIWAGRVSGEPNVITLDVGGTSADIGLAQDGKLRMKHLLDTKVGPYQAMIPMVDVDTIGAGGGSIAYIDAGGIFRVGPRSAGADPGPAAYDRGGTEPTATDALITLGWLRPELFLGGRIALREDLARQAIDEHIGKPLGISTEEAAMGIYRILVHSMVDAIEQNSVRKGFDPRDFSLVAEGGAGPLFTADIAPEVGTRRVLVPSYPGITAALGLLTTDMVYEYPATSYAMCSAALRRRRRAARGWRSSSRSSRRRPPRSSSTTASRATGWCCSASPTPATRARATSCASTSGPARSTTRGSTSSRAASTTSTSASTRGASTRPTCSSPTSACAQSARCRTSSRRAWPAGRRSPRAARCTSRPTRGSASTASCRRCRRGSTTARSCWPATSSRARRSSRSSTRRRWCRPASPARSTRSATWSSPTATRSSRPRSSTPLPARRPADPDGAKDGYARWLICPKSASRRARPPARASTSTPSPCAWSAARSTPSPRRWPASSSA